MKILFAGLLLFSSLTFAAESKFQRLVLEEPYFTSITWHPGYGNNKDAYVVFTVGSDVKPDEVLTYAAVGLATLTQTCTRQDGMIVWHQTSTLVNSYTTTYSAIYQPGSSHSAQIRGTYGPQRFNFPQCLAPNTLRLDSVNWLAVTLYDLTEAAEGEIYQYPASRE